MINPMDNTVIKTIGVGDLPTGVAVNPDGSVYVSNHDSDTVSVIDPATNTVSRTIDVDGAPQSVAVSPDGTRVAVTMSDQNDYGEVSGITTSTDQVIGTVGIGTNEGPSGVAIVDAPWPANNG
ncbi:YncE family protein [Streptomyces sp. NPDC127178]|uniref:YncE family protein n=1 Tax=unclassified Streptomyces TaxID=2593676 RepID=UPI00363BA00F